MRALLIPAVRVFALSSLLTLSARPALVLADAAAVRACQEPIRQQLERLQSELRTGYRGRRGETLKKRRHALQLRLRECRRSRKSG